MAADTTTRRADLDNLRTFLTVLVICHHAAIALGAAGGWYYVIPPPPGSLAPLPLTMFTGVNQAFFMSLFFAISAYFTPPAYAARSAGRFLRDRGLRLGLPLLVFFFVLNPVVVYLAQRFEGRATEGFGAFLSANVPAAFGTGPLWFVLALLLFTTGYAGLRALRERSARPPGSHPFPGDGRILGFVLAIGAIAFGVRLDFPVGWAVLGLQLGYFPLYIAFFVFGLRARESGWLESLDARRARRWFAVALVAILLLPALIVLGGGLSGRADAFRGGFTWQALAYAFWEPLLCVGISWRLVVLFRARFARQTPLSARMARNAYTAYILHPLFVVPMTALLAELPGGPLVHFVLLCPLSVVSCFAVSDLVRRLPGLRQIL